jgi:hypothetical protein
MRRLSLGAVAVFLGCLFVGCTDESDKPPTPESTQSAVDAVKKLQQGAVPTPKGMQPASDAKSNAEKK